MASIILQCFLHLATFAEESTMCMIPGLAGDGIEKEYPSDRLQLESIKHIIYANAGKENYLFLYACPFSPLCAEIWGSSH
jgi:hypothetical protein